MKKPLILLFLLCSLLSSLSAKEFCSLGTVGSLTKEKDDISMGIFVRGLLSSEFIDGEVLDLGSFFHAECAINGQRISQKETNFYVEGSLCLGLSTTIEFGGFQLSFAAGPALSGFDPISIEAMDQLALGAYGSADLAFDFGREFGLDFGVQCYAYPIRFVGESIRKELQWIPGAYLGLSTTF